jgi:hypothetical protein
MQSGNNQKEKSCFNRTKPSIAFQTINSKHDYKDYKIEKIHISQEADELYYTVASMPTLCFQNSVSWVRPPKVSPQLSGSGSQALRMGTIKTARRKGLASAGAGFAKTIFFSGNKYISDF